MSKGEMLRGIRLKNESGIGWVQFLQQSHCRQSRCLKVKPIKTIPLRALNSIQSGRRDRACNLLVLRDGDNIWVARSGDDPRAWSKKDGARSGLWMPGRPPVDAFLRPPEAYEVAAGAIRKTLLKAWDEIDMFEDLEGPAVQWRLLRDPMARLRCGLRDDVLILRVVRRYLKSRGIAPACVAPGQAVDPKVRKLYSALVSLMERRPRAVDSRTADRWIRLRKALRQMWHLRLARVWAAQFPEDGIRFLEKAGYEDRKWHVLNVWMRAPEGRSLFEDHPQLAWMLGSSWVFKERPVQWPMRSIRSLVRGKRSRILEWLDLPPGEGTLNLIRRVPCSKLSGQTAARLRMVLRCDRSRRWLANLPGVITPEILAVLAFGKPVSFPILRAMAEDGPTGARNHRMRVIDVHGHILQMLHHLGAEPGEIRDIANIRSFKRLWSVHERLVERMGRHSGSAEGALASMNVLPPLAPAPWMTPLKTLQDMEVEGMTMHHCVASFATRVSAGAYYVYAIDHPLGRATLGITKRQDGRWMRVELRGKCNHMVPHALVSEVDQWLVAMQRGESQSLNSRGESRPEVSAIDV